jgi:hypothetical protein
LALDGFDSSGEIAERAGVPCRRGSALMDNAGDSTVQCLAHRLDSDTLLVEKVSRLTLARREPDEQVLAPDVVVARPPRRM